MPLMDIRSGVIALALFALLFAVISVRGGLRAIQSARKMTFYRLRRKREAGGWRLLGLALLLVALAVWLPVYGQPLAFEYFPPSPTPSVTPTITPIPTLTVSPTITLSPTVTDTPLVTDTPTASPTPFIPSAIKARFQSTVTPNPDTVFSPLLFTVKSSNYPAEAPNTVFENPVGHLYAIFSYDKMALGVQWTALWLRDGQRVHYETKPWDCAGCGLGGSGFTDWNPSPEQWLPGIYEVQSCIGEEYVTNGRFLVEGAPPTAIPTASRTPTFTPVPRPRGHPPLQRLPPKRRRPRPRRPRLQPKLPDWVVYSNLPQRR